MKRLPTLTGSWRSCALAGILQFLGMARLAAHAVRDSDHVIAAVGQELLLPSVVFASCAV
jgi:hypothetical protein